MNFSRRFNVDATRGPSVGAASQCERVASDLRDCFLTAEHDIWTWDRIALHHSLCWFLAFASSTHTKMASTWKWTPGSKLCFVTTGATAPFNALIESVLSPSSLDAMLENGFTHLLVQYGSAKDVFTQASTAARSHVQDKLVIDGIDFNPEGLEAQLRLVQQSKGLAISHAGSGSILEALRYGIPLVVVPNTGLLDNHQEELADAMERSGYLLRGDVEYVERCLRLCTGLMFRTEIWGQLSASPRSFVQRWLSSLPLLVESIGRQRALRPSWTRLWASWIEKSACNCSSLRVLTPYG